MIPPYVTELFHNMTDPGEDHSGLQFDDGAAVAEVPGWRNRFGQNYDPERLGERILARTAKSFDATVHVVENETEVDPSCYVKFALVLRRRRSVLLGLLGFYRPTINALGLLHRRRSGRRMRRAGRFAATNAFAPASKGGSPCSSAGGG